jgi:hypothetical protein
MFSVSPPLPRLSHLLAGWRPVCGLDTALNHCALRQATEILDSGRLKLATTVDLFYFTRMNEMSQEVMTASATARGAPLNVSLNGAVSVQYVTNFTLPEWR